MRFQKYRAERFPAESARRQGEVTRLAMMVLGREAAIVFMNTANAQLGGRPIDLAVESEEGRGRVEAELGRLKFGGSEATIRLAESLAAPGRA